MITQPYKDELLPHWRFKTPAIAEVSAKRLYAMFEAYIKDENFVGADMARKFLMMGWTRSRRYANHASGRKYDAKKRVTPQDENSETSIKAESARIFFEYYSKAKDNEQYKAMKAAWLTREKTLFSAPK